MEEHRVPNAVVVGSIPTARSMKTAKLKYPCKISGHLFPAGTVVEVLDAIDPTVQAVFPGIKHNPASKQIAVRFPNHTGPTICSVSQLDLVA